MASLSMYASPAPVAAATAAFWRALRDRLRAAGLTGVPDTLSDLAYDAAWLRPDLLLAQTCGYPYVTRLKNTVRLVATPVYDRPGCDGAQMCAFLIVPDRHPALDLADLAGARAAVNQADSNSGANLFRAMVAPLARDGRFFGSAVVTGSHGASIDAVREGRADIAAIDCITFSNIQRFDPDRLSGVRVLGETMKGPGLPFVTGRHRSQAEQACLRRALDETIADPHLSDVRDTLGLTGFVTLDDAAYAKLSDLAAQAQALGYPTAGA